MWECIEKLKVWDKVTILFDQYLDFRCRGPCKGRMCLIIKCWKTVLLKFYFQTLKPHWNILYIMQYNTIYYICSRWDYKQAFFTLIFERRLLIICYLSSFTRQRVNFEFLSPCWVAHLSLPMPGRGGGQSWTWRKLLSSLPEAAPLAFPLPGGHSEYWWGKAGCRCEPVGSRAVTQQTSQKEKILKEKNYK